MFFIAFALVIAQQNATNSTGGGGGSPGNTTNSTGGGGNSTNQSSFCIETDGGENIILRGTNNAANGSVLTDICTSNGPIVNNTHVLERVCIADGEVRSRNIFCTNGCVNGACVPSLPSRQFIRGDSNRDGIVDMTDTITLFGYLFNSVPAVLKCEDSADVNDNGVVDMSDGIFLLNYLFNNLQRPPAPFPTQGVDPTSDSLGCNA